MESVCWGNSTVGSNPTLSAITVSRLQAIASVRAYSMNRIAAGSSGAGEQKRRINFATDRFFCSRDTVRSTAGRGGAPTTRFDGECARLISSSLSRAVCGRVRACKRCQDYCFPGRTTNLTYDRTAHFFRTETTDAVYRSPRSSETLYSTGVC